MDQNEKNKNEIPTVLDAIISLSFMVVGACIVLALVELFR